MQETNILLVEDDRMIIENLTNSDMIRSRHGK